MEGDHTLFLRQDGVERAWEILEPILQHPSPITFYDRGSWGPPEADALIAPRKWHVTGEHDEPDYVSRMRVIPPDRLSLRTRRTAGPGVSFAVHPGARRFRMKDERTRFDLPPEAIPSAWFNLMPDLAQKVQPLPPLNPMTKQPIGPEDLAPLFPMSLIGQEVSSEPWIDIPGPVIDVYRLWRPTPLFRATRLERALDTPARIYFKYEGVSPAGSHKPNTAVPQAYFNKEAGNPADRDRDGRRSVGLRDGDGLQLLRARVHGVHGEGFLRPEALPPGVHGDVRSERAGLAVDDDERGARRSSKPIRTRRDRSASRSARRSRTPPPMRTRTTRSAACSATCCFIRA